MAHFPGFTSFENENNDQKIMNEDVSLDQSSGKAFSTLVPSITIFMLQSLKQDEKQNFVIDGKVTSQIRLMGRIVDCKEDQFKTTYTMVDETGKIDIVIYKSENKILSMVDNDSSFKYSENCLAEVLGSPQLQKNYLSVSGTEIENIYNLTKYDKFLLTVAFGYYQRNLGNNQDALLVEILEKEKENEKGPKKSNIVLSSPKSSPSLLVNQKNVNLDEIEKQILSIISDSEGGRIGREEIYDKLNTKCTYHDFRERTKHLMAVGKIIKVDENYFEICSE